MPFELNNSFCVLSINSKRSPLEIRNKISFSNKKIKETYNSDKYKHIDNLIILSTCNRVEIYTSERYVKDVEQILLCESKLTKKELFENIIFFKDSMAVKHLCNVTSGLESQILGDYEIISQVKNAFLLAKEFKRIEGRIEKIFSVSFEVSKDIKTKTGICDGTTSVSFYVILYLKEFLDLKNKIYNLGLFGLGKIGMNVLKNLQHYIPGLNITIVNRSDDKAAETAKRFNTDFVNFEQNKKLLESLDILIVATGAEEQIILKEDVEKSSIKYIFDLSVPSNIDPEIRKLRYLKVINIDELSSLTNTTLVNRQSRVPFAKKIIEEHVIKLTDWIEKRKQFTSKAKQIG